MIVPTEFQVFSPVTDGVPCRVRRDRMQAIYKSHDVSKGTDRVTDYEAAPRGGRAGAVVSALAEASPLFLRPQLPVCEMG